MLQCLGVKNTMSAIYTNGLKGKIPCRNAEGEESNKYGKMLTFGESG